MATAPEAGTASAAPPAAAAKQPNVVARLWKKADIQPVFLILAVKGALPSVIALAAFEATAWSKTYTTLGYLVAIMAHLSLAIQPRAKFIQAMFFSLLFTCTGAAVSLLQIQCAVAARSPSPAPSVTGSSGSKESTAYDSSAATVTAIWLCITVFLANTLRAARPQLQLPVIQYSIFTVVASIYAPSFPNMTAGISFVQRLLRTFLTGFAIGTGVSLFVFPMTSRVTVTKQLLGMNGIFKGMLGTHRAYMQTISANGPYSPEHKAQAKKYQGMVIAMAALYGKIRLELGFARKEIAFGKFRPEHLTEIFYLMRGILSPFMGLATFINIIDSMKENRENRAEIPNAGRTLEAVQQLEEQEWDEVMSLSRDAFLRFQGGLMGGLTHVNYVLEFEKRPKQAKQDVEKKAGTPQPGDAEFANFLADEVKAYHKQREDVISQWASNKGITLPEHFRDRGGDILQNVKTTAARAHTNQQQLFLILFLNYLTHRLGLAILEYVEYADARVKDGTMKRKRLIFPGWKRLRKLFRDAAVSGDADDVLGNEVSNGANIFLGDALMEKKNPEHLPPANAFEKVGNYIRKIPAALASEPAAFGFRAMVATISIGVIGYLKATRPFFLQQRGLWVLIMTAISMDPHAGQSIFGFVARSLGTVVAAVSAIAIWYMCDKKHGAIIPIYGIYASFWFLFLLKKPQFAVVAIISSVTVILVIGYELQVDDLGRALATSNGQEYYPVYLLAAYRLVAVLMGLGVAFFWTIIPYPLTTHGTLRRDTGNALYLLANFYSCVHTTLEARLTLGPAVNHLPANHPVVKLDAARVKVFNKCLMMLSRLREYHRFSKFEPPIGGKFPSATYDQLITSMAHVFTNLALITYSSTAFTQEAQSKISINTDADPDKLADPDEAEWLASFRSFASSTSLTSHSITSQLCLLSASLRNASPLPPYLGNPQVFDPAEHVEASDPELLSVDHFSHPCYAAFAVNEVASAFVQAEVCKITRLVRELVGEVDFSWHVVSSGAGSEASTLWEKEQADSKTSVNGSAKEGSHWKRKGD